MILKQVRTFVLSIGLVLFLTGAVLSQGFTIQNYPLPPGVTASRLKVNQGKAWLGTGFGALTFDGESFERIDASAGLDIGSTYVIDAEPSGKLWFVGETGIATWYNGSFSYFDHDNHASTIWTLDATDDALWFGNGTTLAKINDSGTISYYANQQYINIERDKDGKYWALSKQGLSRLENTTWVLDSAFTNGTALHFDKNGDMWLATLFKTIRRRAGSKLIEEVGFPEFNNYDVRIITSDQNGTIYFGTAKQGLVVKDGDVWSILGKDDYVYDIDVDADGNIWFVHAGAYEGDWVHVLSLITKDEWHNSEPAHGVVYADSNGNGVRDAGEPGIPNQFIRLAPSGSYAITDPDGHFSFMPATGENTLTAEPTDFWREGETPLSHTFNYTGTETLAPFEIGYAWLGILNLQPNLVPSTARPGFSTIQYVEVRNQGSIPAHVKVTYQYDSRLTFISSKIKPDVIDGNRLTWDFGTVQPFNDILCYVNFQLPADVPLGTVLTSSIYLDSTLFSNDLNTGVNRDTARVTVIGSYDPNDKAVDQGRGNEHYTLMNTPLTYRIRFQNTGTDVAFTVKIKDELDANLDVPSLRIRSSSHPMTYRLDDRMLTFTFNDIMLPDSTHNEPGSHGYVEYSISPRAGFAENTVVRNIADIYFDFNAPVTTNEVFNTYVTQYPGGEPNPGSDPITAIEQEQSSVAIYPNPSADGTIQIVLSNVTAVQSGELITASGNRMVQFSNIPVDGRIVLNNIPAGLYLLRLRQGASVTVTKVVVTR